MLKTTPYLDHCYVSVCSIGLLLTLMETTMSSLTRLALTAAATLAFAMGAQAQQTSNFNVRITIENVCNFTSAASDVNFVTVESGAAKVLAAGDSGGITLCLD